MTLKVITKLFSKQQQQQQKKTGKCTIEVKRLRFSGLEILKALKKVNPVFIKDLSHGTKWLTHRRHNVQLNAPKTTKYCNKSLRTFRSFYFELISKTFQSRKRFFKFQKIYEPLVWTNLLMQLICLA